MSEEPKGDLYVPHTPQAGPTPDNGSEGLLPSYAPGSRASARGPQGPAELRTQRPGP